jgi:hypothetical protein
MCSGGRNNTKEELVNGWRAARLSTCRDERGQVKQKYQRRKMVPASILILVHGGLTAQQIATDLIYDFYGQ